MDITDLRAALNNQKVRPPRTSLLQRMKRLEDKERQEERYHIHETIQLAHDILRGDEEVDRSLLEMNDDQELLLGTYINDVHTGP